LEQQKSLSRKDDPMAEKDQTRTGAGSATVKTYRGERASKARFKRADEAQRNADRQSSRLEAEEQRQNRARDRRDQAGAGIESTPFSTPQWVSWDEAFALARDEAAQQPYDPENTYDGTTRQGRSIPSSWTIVPVGGVHNVLGNPNRIERWDDFTLFNSLNSHFLSVIDEGGSEFVRLVRKAAEEAAKASEDAFRKTGHADAYKAIAGTALEAKPGWALMVAALQQFPAGKGVIGQKLPTRAGDIDKTQLLETYHANVEPTRMRFRRQKVNVGNSQVEVGGVVSLFADRGFGKAAIEWASQLDKRLLLSLDKNGELWTEARKLDGRKCVALYSPKAKGFQVTSQIAKASDGAFFFLNGDPKSFASEAFAEFFRQGKALRVFGPDGRELPVLATGRDICKHHMSTRERAMSRDTEVHDIELGTPEAALAFSLMSARAGADKRILSIPPRDVAHLASMDGTISNVVEMARQKDGQALLAGRHNVSKAAIKLLGDPGAMSSARQAMKLAAADLAQNMVDTVGPEAFSDTMVAPEVRIAGLFHSHLFVQGDVSLLTKARTPVGVIGTDRGRLAMDSRGRDIVQPKAQALVDGLAAQTGVTLVSVAGATPAEMPAAPRILICPAGAAQTTPVEASDVRATLKDGGLVIYMQPPTSRSWHYDKNAIDSKTGRKGAVVTTSTSHTDHIHEQKAVDLFCSISQTVVVTDLDPAVKQDMQKRAVETSLSIGRKPVIVDISGYEGYALAGGSRALLNGTGRDALVKAGLPVRAAEELGAKIKGYPAIGTGQNMQKAAETLALRLNGDPTAGVPRNRKSRMDQALEA